MTLLRLFTSVLFAGRSPVAPGTVGSLAALPFIWFIQVYLQTPLWACILILVVLSISGVLASSRLSQHLGVEDPQEIVIDEFVGQWIALLAVPPGWVYWLVGFALFRLFDIWKPGPINRSQELPNGVGVMADDILAGLLALLIIQGVHAFL